MLNTLLLMRKSIKKKPLDLNLYKIFEIPQEYMAYILEFENVDESESENLEAEYFQKGYKIFHSELTRTNSGLFDLKIILAKLEMIT